VEIRRLTAADVPRCKELSADRGWLREDNRWPLLVEISEVYGIDAPDGGLAGAVVLSGYGAFAAIGMMLVARRWERKGLGRRLVSHAVAAAGGVTVTLLATGNGRPMYSKLGFAEHGTSVTYLGTLPAAPAVTRPATAADLRAILARDAAAFGGDRSRLLMRLPTFARLRVAPAGYGAAWRNGDHTVIGPVVADDLPTAKALITDLAAGTPCRLDITSYQPDLAAWAADHLAPHATVTIMSYGGRPPGDPSRRYLPFSVATG
jgi:GNAT superfamily N-acetyltransferase